MIEFNSDSVCYCFVFSQKNSSSSSIVRIPSLFVWKNKSFMSRTVARLQGSGLKKNSEMVRKVKM